jgi:hypothetical protein
VREYNDIYKARGHEAFRLQFEAERERERLEHLQIRAAKLRRDIYRDGIVIDHDGCWWNISIEI